MDSPERDSYTKKAEEKRLYRQYLFIYAASILVALTLIVLLIVWIAVYEGGFSSTDVDKKFNFHPVLMIYGLVILNGNSILIYRSFRIERKNKLKIVHTALNVKTLAVFLASLYVAIEYLLKKNYSQFTSLHSWLGITTITIYAAQLVAGAFIFWTPKVSESFRKLFLPFHLTVGIGVFIMASANAVLGLSNFAGNFNGSGAFANCIGMLLVIYSFMVIFLVTQTQFKREPLQEETPLFKKPQIAIE